MTAIPRLHLISSCQHCPLERFPHVAAEAAAGAVDAVHIREPALDDHQLADLVRSTRAALAESECRLLVNWNVDVAVATGADGVHLPEHGSDPVDVRSRLDGGALVGMSVHSVGGAVAAWRAGVDYVIAGHVYETGSKPGQAGRGLEFLREVVRSVDIPVIAIGGITPENAPEVVKSGAYGIAVLSGILTARDPEAAASRYASALEHCRGVSE